MAPSTQQQIFLSYQRDDAAFAEGLRSWLLERGLQPWMDVHDIPAGAYWPDVIDEALQASDIVIGILSPSSVASRNVKNEWDWALGNDRQLILLLVEPCDIPHRYYTLNYLDFTMDSRDSGYASLSRTLDVADVVSPPRIENDQPESAFPTPARRRIREAPVMVGREREFDQLKGLLDRAVDGKGNLVLVGGEAGIGKTTLTSVLIVEAEQRGTLVLTGGCYDLTTTPPYGPWIEVLQDYPNDPDLPSLPDQLRVGGGMEGVDSQSALFELTARFVTDVAGHISVVLILEDLHWADQASLDLLRYLARSISDLRILILVTYRDDELTRRHRFYQLLPVLIRESTASQINLRRLDANAIRALLRATHNLPHSDEDRLLNHFQQLTEGNPFYFSELLRSLEADQILQKTEHSWKLADLGQTQVPPLIRQVIDNRLARLHEDTQIALNIAAVIGHEFSFSLWSQVSDIADESLLDILEEAIDAYVLEEPVSTDDLRFTHALIRESLYESMIRPRRRLLHMRIAEDLAKQTKPDPDMVADHFQRANDKRAFDWLVRAGERAHYTFALLTAVDRYDEALAMLADEDDTVHQRGWLLYRIGTLYRVIDRVKSLSYLAHAQHLATRSDDALLLSYCRYMQGLVHEFSGGVNRGLAEMEGGVKTFETLTVNDLALVRSVATGLFGEEQLQLDSSLDDEIDGTRPLFTVNPGQGTLSMWQSFTGRFQQAIRNGLAVRAAIERIPEPTTADLHSAGDAEIGLGQSYAILGKPDQAQRAFERALDFFLTINHIVLVGGSYRSLVNYVYLPFKTEDVIERKRLAREELDFYKNVDESFTPKYLLPQADNRIDGNWNEIREMALDVISDPFTEDTRRRAIRALAVVTVDQGRYDEAWTYLGELFPSPSAVEPGSLAYSVAIDLLQVAAKLSMNDDNLADARSWIEAHDRWLNWSGAVLDKAEGELLWARYYQLTEDLVTARQRAEKALKHASDPRQPLSLIAAHRFLGQLDLAERRYELAHENLRISLELATACEAPFERALILLEIARLRHATDRPHDARALLAEVREICEPLEAKPTLDRVATLEAELDAADG